MKEEKTKSKKKLIYYLVLAAGVLLLAAATVLTVYFVTQEKNVLSEEPPAVTPDDPVGPEKDPTPDDPDLPSAGDAVRFVSPVENGVFKTEYFDVYDNKTLGWGYYHKAVDYDAAEGTEVRAIGDGTVVEVSYQEFTGNLVVIDHGDNLYSYYRFVEPVEGLGKGDKVKKGDKIGTVAAAYGIEQFDGAHLHFEMKRGSSPVNPADYLDVILEEK